MANEDWAVDLEGCRGRQNRLLAEMHSQGIELAIITRMESIQWLTGARVGPLFHPTAALDASGRVTLVLPSRKIETPAAADEVLSYEEKWLSTMRDASDQQVASSEQLFGALGELPKSIACERTSASLCVTRRLSAEPHDLDPVLFKLRLRKDPDELRMLRRANDANKAMYAAARESIKPGLNEIELFNLLHSTAVSVLGEPLTYFGQDFRANARGGAPRKREAQAGELWILDLGVGFRGYHSDNARTICVDIPTDDQQRAWEKIVPVFDLVQSTVTPGSSCKALFEQAHGMLAEAEPWLFNHHLGHGVGLAPHEGPHLNPNWEDTFEVGNFFAVEPGLYHEELKHGIRLEQNYVVTETGVELVTDWPLGL